MFISGQYVITLFTQLAKHCSFVHVCDKHKPHETSGVTLAPKLDLFVVEIT
jgi:hypothetical protein